MLKHNHVDFVRPLGYADSNMAKKTAPSPRQRLPFLYPRHVFMGLIVILLVVYGGGLWYLFHENDVRVSQSVAQMVITSVDRLSATPAPTDAASGRLYFHEAGLMLPPLPQPLSFGGLSYLYTPALGQSGPQLQLINRSDVLSAEQRLRVDTMNAVFNTAFDADVSKLQACALGLTLTYDKQPAPDATKLLSNGRTLYFYWDANHRCVNPDLLHYAEQITPY